MNRAYSTTLPRSAEALEQQLRREGFHPGAPAHILPATLAIDRRMCKRLKCPRCRRRGCGFRPYTDGQSYRVLAVCTCGAAVEM